MSLLKMLNLAGDQRDISKLKPVRTSHCKVLHQVYNSGYTTYNSRQVSTRSSAIGRLASARIVFFFKDVPILICSERREGDEYPFLIF